MKKILLIGLMLTYAGANAQQNQDARLKAQGKVNPALLNISAPVPNVKGGADMGAPINPASVLKAIERRESILSGTNGYQNGSNNGSVNQSGGTRATTATEAVIGTTQYDLQTNNTISNRIVNYYDGKISAVWTFSPNATSGYPQRGTGYNVFNGGWDANPTSRLENVRAGFTNIGVTLTGKEVVAAHGIQTTGPSKGILFTSRPTIGSGSWTTDENILSGGALPDTIDVWSKLAVGGTDGKTIHIIWRGGSASTKYYGQDSPILYSRSQDDGVTWDKIQTIVPGLDSTYYLGWSADEYSIDAKDSVVAIVASSLGNDVVLVKSTDNGNTWTRNVVFSYPIPMFNSATMSTDTNADSTPDTLWTGSGDANLVIDTAHKVHVVFSAFRTLGSVGSLSYFPYSSQLFYWNESMLADSVAFLAFVPDLDESGVIDVPPSNSTDCPSDPFSVGTYGTTVRLVEQPTAGVDAFNNIYVLFHAMDEFSDQGTAAANYGKFFKHPYIMKSSDGGATWTDYNKAFDVIRGTKPTTADFLEGSFACMAKRVDSKIHLVYQRDEYPGTSLATAGTCNQILNGISQGLSEIVYVAVDTNLSVVGINEFPAKKSGVALSANFPNPATDYTQFNVSLNKSMNVQLAVSDILGQNVYSENKGKLTEGIHTVTLNTAYLAPGVYFYTVTAGDEKVTGKMTVR